MLDEANLKVAADYNISQNIHIIVDPTDGNDISKISTKNISMFKDNNLYPDVIILH